MVGERLRPRRAGVAHVAHGRRPSHPRPPGRCRCRARRRRPLRSDLAVPLVGCRSLLNHWPLPAHRGLVPPRLGCGCGPGRPRSRGQERPHEGGPVPAPRDSCRQHSPRSPLPASCVPQRGRCQRSARCARLQQNWAGLTRGVRRHLPPVAGINSCRTGTPPLAAPGGRCRTSTGAASCPSTGTPRGERTNCIAPRHPKVILPVATHGVRRHETPTRTRGCGLFLVQPTSGGARPEARTT